MDIITEYLTASRQQAEDDLLAFDDWWGSENETIDTAEMAIEMVQEGIFLWEDSLFWRDLGFYLFPVGMPQFFDNLIKMRMLAEAIVSNAPEYPLDPELIARLRYVADGQFCVAYEGEYCLYPTALNPWRSSPLFDRS